MQLLIRQDLSLPFCSLSSICIISFCCCFLFLPTTFISLLLLLLSKQFQIYNFNSLVVSYIKLFESFSQWLPWVIQLKSQFRTTQFGLIPTDLSSIQKLCIIPSPFLCHLFAIKSTSLQIICYEYRFIIITLCNCVLNLRDKSYTQKPHLHYLLCFSMQLATSSLVLFISSYQFKVLHCFFSFQPEELFLTFITGQVYQ